MKEQPITLATLAGGAAVELFDAELQEVLRNIADPNTKPDAKRSITITVTFQPNEEREVGQVSVQSKSKLATTRHVETFVYMGRDSGRFVAVEHNPKQLSFDNTAHIRPAKPAQGGEE